MIVTGTDQHRAMQALESTEKLLGIIHCNATEAEYRLAAQTLGQAKECFEMGSPDWWEMIGEVAGMYRLLTCQAWEALDNKEE